MENQHRKINGYRDLTQEEIDLINEIKAKAEELHQLHQKVYDLVGSQLGVEAVLRHRVAEPYRWLDIAKTDLQTGVMALTRAVAQPTANW